MIASSGADFELVESAERYLTVVRELAAETGPVAADTERASGFRYSNRAYLVQVQRGDSRIYLIDAGVLNDLSTLNDALRDEMWVLHAATQDLPSLREAGVHPQRIFDTELAAKLLGRERVGLAYLHEDLLEVHLPKEHSAVDWSIRPMQDSWLEYAAADVRDLNRLCKKLQEELESADRIHIAEQEFAALVTWQPKPAHPEPWRKLRGLHELRDRRGLAVARELWLSRDELAARRDVAPGRLIPDSSVVAAAQALPRSRGELAGLKTFHGRASRNELDRWWQAIQRGKATDDLPPVRMLGEREIPSYRSWPKRFPEAHARLEHSKDVLNKLSEELGLSRELILNPDVLRTLAWQPPQPLTSESVAQRLAQLGAREWQVELTADSLREALITQ